MPETTKLESVNMSISNAVGFSRSLKFRSSSPPSGNTGVTVTKVPLYPFIPSSPKQSVPSTDTHIDNKYDGQGCEFGIDWLNLSTLCPLDRVADFLPYVASWLQDELVPCHPIRLRGSCEYFNYSHRTTRGSQVLVANDEAAIAKYNGLAKIYLSISGDSLRALGLEGQLRFLIAINSPVFDFTFPSKARNYLSNPWFQSGNKKWKCSRIDVGMSDFGKKLPVSQIESALRDKNYSGFEKCGQYHNFDSFGTFTFGSRESYEYRRAYDESAKTFGVRDAHRLEVEFKGDFSQTAYEMIMDLINARDYELELQFDTTYQFLKELVFGNIDFLDRSSFSDDGVLKIESHLNRCQRFDWWQEYLDYVDVSGIKLPRSSYKKTIEAKCEWAVKQVMPSLALLKKAFPHRFFQWLCDNIRAAGDRISESDLAMLRVWLSVNEPCSNWVPAVGVDF